MSFDQEPDAPLHGECAAEIARLERELAEAQRYAKRYRLVRECGNRFVWNGSLLVGESLDAEVDALLAERSKP